MAKWVLCDRISTRIKDKFTQLEFNPPCCMGQSVGQLRRYMNIRWMQKRCEYLGECMDKLGWIKLGVTPISTKMREGRMQCLDLCKENSALDPMGFAPFCFLLRPISYRFCFVSTFIHDPHSINFHSHFNSSFHLIYIFIPLFHKIYNIIF